MQNDHRAELVKFVYVISSELSCWALENIHLVYYDYLSSVWDIPNPEAVLWWFLDGYILPLVALLFHNATRNMLAQINLPNEPTIQ